MECEQRRKETAYHEVAHEVIARHYGLLTHIEVWIDDNHGWQGICEYYYHSPRSANKNSECAIIGYAGSIVEYYFINSQNDIDSQMSDSDWESVNNSPTWQEKQLNFETARELVLKYESEIHRKAKRLIKYMKDFEKNNVKQKALRVCFSDNKTWHKRNRIEFNTLRDFQKNMRA